MVAKMTLSPADAFGNPAATAPRAVLVRASSDVRIHFDQNTGRVFAGSATFLPPLMLQRVLGPGVDLAFQANEVALRWEAASVDDLLKIPDLAEFYVPAYLSLTFGIYVGVESIVGEVERACAFRYELAVSRFGMTTLDEGSRANKVEEALTFAELRGHSSLRLILAVMYFQQALRFLSSHESRVVGLNMAEVLLNLAKSLHLLFGSQIDDVRRGCRQVGYSNAQIESQIAGLLHGRNRLDVAHEVGRRVPYELVEVLREYGDRAVQAVILVAPLLGAGRPPCPSRRPLPSMSPRRYGSLPRPRVASPFVPDARASRRP
jgi:hypothetical protein